MACEDYRSLDETLIFGNVAESGHLLPLHQRPAGNRSENNSRAAECVKADEVGGTPSSAKIVPSKCRLRQSPLVLRLAESHRGSAWTREQHVSFAVNPLVHVRFQLKSTITDYN